MLQATHKTSRRQINKEVTTGNLEPEQETQEDHLIERKLTRKREQLKGMGILQVKSE